MRISNNLSPHFLRKFSFNGTYMVANILKHEPHEKTRKNYLTKYFQKQEITFSREFLEAITECIVRNEIKNTRSRTDVVISVVITVPKILFGVFRSVS